MCRHKLALATLFFAVLALLLCPQRLLASQREPAGIFGLEALGGRGGVSFFSQLIVTAVIVIFARLASTLVYGSLKMTVGIRLDPHEEQIGTDLAVHMIEAHPGGLLKIERIA